MYKFLLVFCCFFIIPYVAMAEEDTTSADGAGTIVIGVSGYKYCLSNKTMNWWNAYAWCDGLKNESGAPRHLFRLEDCQCDNKIANCAKNICAEMKGGITNGRTVMSWTATPVDRTYAYAVFLGQGGISSTYNHNANGIPDLCK